MKRLGELLVVEIFRIITHDMIRNVKRLFEDLFEGERKKKELQNYLGIAICSFVN